MRKLQCERIKRHLDEHPCDWCGGPVYVGDAGYYDEETGGAYCSERCGAADLADGQGKGGRWAALTANLVPRSGGAK